MSARRSVLAVPGRDLGTLVVGGADRLSWLNGLVTSDLAHRGEDDATYGLVVGRTGRVIVDVIVVADAASLYVAAASTATATLRAHLDHHLVMEDAEVTPGDGFESWLLHGPRSLDVLRAARDAGGVGGLLDRTGLGGAIVVAPSPKASSVREAVVRAVAAASGAIGDDGSWETLRLERAVPRFSADFDDKTYPQEASLEKAAVSFDKGCYLGQEVVCMLELRGHVKRKLVPLVLATPAVPARGAQVVDEGGAAIGEVTSAAFSPTLGVAVALAMVKRSHCASGTAVLVQGARAKVVERPA
jgi:folate-binding protein YgfZ